jgi:hypothetical protein
VLRPAAREYGGEEGEKNRRRRRGNCRARARSPPWEELTPTYDIAAAIDVPPDRELREPSGAARCCSAPMTPTTWSCSGCCGTPSPPAGFPTAPSHRSSPSHSRPRTPPPATSMTALASRSWSRRSP